MSQEFVIKIAAALIGTLTGGGLLMWFAKLMAARLITQYDNKHAEHEKKLSLLSDKIYEQLLDLKLKLAKLEPLVTAAITIREDLKAAEGDIAVLEYTVNKVHDKDISQAHEAIREIRKKLPNTSGH